MSKRTPWPIHQVYRSQPINEMNHQRSPSPIVELPLSPDPESNNGPNMNIRYPSSIERSLSPRRSQSPFNSGLNKGVREIPIEVEHEVKTAHDFSTNFSTKILVRQCVICRTHQLKMWYFAFHLCYMLSNEQITHFHCDYFYTLNSDLRVPRGVSRCFTYLIAIM